MSAATPSEQVAWELRPLGVADLLDLVWRVYRGHFGQLVRISAVVHVPLGIVQTVAVLLLYEGFDIDAGFEQLSVRGLAAIGAYVLLLALALPIVQAAMARAVSEYYLGRRPSIREVYGFALRHLPSLLGVSAIAWLIIVAIWAAFSLALVAVILSTGLLGGEVGAVLEPAFAITALLVVLVAVTAGLAAMVRLYAAAIVVVLEDCGAIRAISRSWQLTAGRFWTVLVVLGVLGLLVGALTMSVIWPFSFGAEYLVQSGVITLAIAEAIRSGLSATGEVTLQPLQIVGSVLLYYDLRMRKEGFDLVMMAEAIGRPQLARRTDTGQAAPALYGPGATLPDETELEGTDESADTDTLPQ